MSKCKEFVEERFNKQFKGGDVDFPLYWDEYLEVENFAPNGNINDNQKISDEAHFCMRMATQYHITKAFSAMRIDLTDHNVSEDFKSGNLGTPGRIAKVWCGFDTDDDRELGSGRWAKKPRLATFPNQDTNNNIPITKRIDIVSNCSHHFITFSSLARPDSYAIVSYIPDKFVLGISKLQRLADWISQRFWLQEDLTNMLYEDISKAAQTDSVYIGLFDLVHGCESFRGAKSNDGSFTSEMYGGAFKDPEMRKSIK